MEFEKQLSEKHSSSRTVILVPLSLGPSHLDPHPQPQLIHRRALGNTQA
jgi:hypothetical protein